MRIASRHTVRSGFTLLEVLLASLIAVLLLGALYVAMDMTLRQSQEARSAVEAENLSRSVFHRMALDLASSLSPLPPKSGGNASQSSSGSGGSSGTSSSSTSSTAASSAPAAGSSGSAAPSAAAASSGSSGSSSSGGAAAPVEADPGFQGGVVGSDTQLTVFVSRVPYALATTGALGQDADSSLQSPADLVRVTYWMGQNGQLCRQERPWVTADGLWGSYEPDTSNEKGDTLAAEVSSVQFEYFDGTDWQTSWDGTTPGPDGVTPTGPPRAVRVTLTFSTPAARPGGPELTQTVKQTIPIRSAPGTNTPPMITPDSDPGTVTPDSSSSGSSGSGSSGGTVGSGTTGGGGAATGSGTTGGGGGAGGGAATPRPTGGTTGGGGAMGGARPAGGAGGGTGGTGGTGGGNRGGGR